ncbi:MAG: holo-ACP synthase [Bacteroidetes bacterium]|nr:holo-ACP synthase [Bacteroidota bacterium]MBS1935767.1 holo-ACP synthase [Bacteroidota bacterium]
MILGTGIDMIEVERVEAKISKHSGFREMVFSLKEIEYCEKKTHPFQHYAARFAAKEAFLKAAGTGWINGTAFNEIEILPDEKGKPVLNLLGETAITFQSLQIKKISVSLSHLKSIASAVVVIEN